MSVRVVARIRPLLKTELERDCIVEPAATDANRPPTIVRIPNPKNLAESYSFAFNSVYDQSASQQDVFDGEISPTVKHLFSGLDVTIFAYGVTGTGKTHTMRGGKSLADRGVIPRLLSAIYRRGRKIEKDAAGARRVQVSMSYYEIYNDKVYDLFEPPEQRTAFGLPIRDNNGKTVVCGLTERPCTTLRDFETLYDAANVNRSTAGTKLNAHSSRSHAVLCVKVSQIADNHTVVSTASAIDLAGSEDNRRTDNGKERLVESSSINKSLFVLAQCVEAISKKHHRIPYRESKMTRILSLGQNNGLTVMILNLAPHRAYHLDTLSSLNFANRTKKIEVREIENEPIFQSAAKAKPKPVAGVVPSTGPRQPLRPITSAATNAGLITAFPAADKPTKSFPVFSERAGALKRPSDATLSSIRPPKALRPAADTTTSIRRPPPPPSVPQAGMTKDQIADLVNRMVDERLAARAPSPAPKPAADLQRRLAALETRVDARGDEGLHLLLVAKQLAAHGEHASALRMYRMAAPFFPHNAKLAARMAALQAQLGTVDDNLDPGHDEDADDGAYTPHLGIDADSDNDDDNNTLRLASPKQPLRTRTRFAVFADPARAPSGPTSEGDATPRTAHVLRVINSRDAAQIRGLRGVGAKKADAILHALGEDEGDLTVSGLARLGTARGVGEKSVEAMRRGVVDV